MKFLSHIDADGNEIRNRYDPVEKEPTGFPNRTDSVISFDNGTRTFSISPASGSFDFYQDGVKYTKNTQESIVLTTNTSGPWYIYYVNGVLTTSQTLWDLSAVVPIAYVLWNSTTSSALLFGDERHGLAMDWRTHDYFHTTIGYKFRSGLLLSGYTLNSDAENDIKIGLSNGSFADEDLYFSIIHSATPTNPFEQILQKPAQIPVFYLVGNPGVWTKDTATDYFFKNTTSGRVNYNQNNASTWQQTQCTSDYFVNYWLCATNSVFTPIISIQGQQEYSSLASAQEETFSSLVFNGIPFAEIKPIYRVTLQTNLTFTNNVRYAKIQFVADMRQSSSGASDSGSISTSHASLSSLNYFSSGHSEFQLLRASNTPPVNPLPGMQWFNTNSGWNILMYWDAVRGSWLSVEAYNYFYGRAATNTGSQYLRLIDGNTSNIQAVTISRNFTVVGLSSATNAINTATFSVRTKSVVDGTLSEDLATLTQTNARYAVDTTQNVNISGPVGIAAYVSGTGLNNPNLTIFLKYRWV